MLKKGDINGNKVSMCIRRVTSITSLKAGITKEDTLCGFSGMLILAKQVHSKTRGGRQKRG